MAQSAPVGAILAARGLSKSFFGNPVLREVSIELRPGRIHALIGENGAGKSTLINLLSGALAPDSGSIELDGRASRSLTPRETRVAGVAVVQQELSLTSHLSVAENIGIGAFPRRFGLVDYPELARRTQAVAALVGLEADIGAPVSNLPLGARQMVEIARALYRSPRVLFLDEPTSSLSAHEAQTLANVLRRLRDSGVAILYISHRLDEVMRLSDHVTVLKDGAVTTDQSAAGLVAADLVRLMVGRDPGDLFPSWNSAAGEVLVRVEGFSAGSIEDVELQIRRGEILGIGGLVGQGQDDLLLGLVGALPVDARAAEVIGLGGVPRSVREANSRGLAYIPADRKREGLHLIHSISWNLLLPTFARVRPLSLRRFAQERKTAGSLADWLGIKGDLTRAVQALSGGNQQKVALARWMPSEPTVLLLNDPTRGVDVETKREIYILLRRLAADGKAIVLSSSDTPELVHLCDRVAVMRQNRIVATLERADLSEEAIVSAAMSANVQTAAA